MGYDISGSYQSSEAKLNTVALNHAIEASEYLNDTPFAEMTFEKDTNYIHGDMSAIRFQEDVEQEYYNIISQYTIEGEISFQWEGEDGITWGARITRDSVEYLEYVGICKDKEKIIKKESLGHIILHRDELKPHIYNDYKALPNAIVEREGTADEYLVFYTVSPKEVR